MEKKRPFMGRALTYLLCLLLVCQVSYSQNPVEQIVEVTLGFNVLKPYPVAVGGKSHEEISIVKDKSVYTLTASNNITAYTEKTATITEQEWNELIKLIADSKILQWKEREFINPEVDDGASTVLQVKLSDQNKINCIWQNYDEGDAKKICSYLIDLANKKIPDSRLYYLRPKQ